ncbi:phosphoglycerate dehydrogenase [Brachybacterium huguangmaarense]|uniref:Phosphoglycerate dehydrogenase n=1 Tax=Brachybacterium huguangmaarense TaxID=1652028 RepID=A0ABY6G3P4_9MICO|nr:phosphoglycerate dehydrogenase [Brachybacterium huguangmaarense]UYG17840.1 phosphoglycerate dehydrogenase [Brachybacterium huguangmaarense]
MKVLLPDTIELSPVLPAGWESAVVDARAEIPAEHHDADALVVWGSSRRHLASAARDLPRLRLVQSLAAGVEGILAAGFGDEVVIASGTGLHSRTVSEHALALILALVRRLPEALAAQDDHEWSSEIGGIQPLHPAGRITTLLDANVLIWGFGDIGQTLAPLLASMGAHVRGVARSAGRRAGFEVVEEDSVRDLLGEIDILVDILPASEATAGVIDADVLAALPDHALVVNVGRGTTVDQAALRAALADGTIAGAGLDVTDPEPLPADDPLWDAPHLLLTPHGAGGRPVGADERIVHNLRALGGDGEFDHRV